MVAENAVLASWAGSLVKQGVICLSVSVMSSCSFDGQVLNLCFGGFECGLLQTKERQKRMCNQVKFENMKALKIVRLKVH